MKASFTYLKQNMKTYSEVPNLENHFLKTANCVKPFPFRMVIWPEKTMWSLEMKHAGDNTLFFDNILVCQIGESSR